MSALLRSVLLRPSLLAAFLSLVVLHSGHAQESRGSGGPEAVIREFYSWYLKAVLANRDPFTQDAAKLKQYASTRFMRQIQKLRDAEEMSFDPFVHAQDVDKAWPKNIKVSKVDTSGEVTKASVELKGPEMGTHKLSVTLRQEGGAWKIDKVDAAE